MKLYANYRVRIRPNVVTIIKRSLVGKGKISVSRGQEVLPEDVIGKSLLSSGFRSINLTSLLGVAPGEVEKYLQKRPGQTLYKNELLAFKKGGVWGGKKIVTSPTDGLIESYNSATGELRMGFLPKNVDLPAAVYGVVESVDNERGQVLIKTETTQMLGLFGSGRIRDGILKFLKVRSGLIDDAQINQGLSAHIVVGGALVYSNAISALLAVGAKGFVTGGMNAKDYRAMAGGHLQFPRKMGTDIGISLIAFEGFGSIPVGEDIISVLQKHDDKFAILDGNSARLYLPSYDKDSMIRVKKTALPSMNALVDPPPEIVAVEVKVGQRARVVVPPFQGGQGKIVYLDKTPTALPSGVRTYLVTLETKSRKIKVPFTNIEII